MLFLWGFLPLVLLTYYVARDNLKNIVLLIASILFYAWGEPKYVLLMFVTITLNYVMGLLMGKTNNKLVMIITVLANVGTLFYFNLFADMVNRISHKNIINMQSIALPIGISFYTFQAMSYVFDLYKGEIKCQKNWIDLALYISFFPQLIAGPMR